MPIIRFGHTVNKVSLANLESLLRICKNKVNIDLKGTDLHSIFSRSRHHALLTTKNASHLSEVDTKYLFDLQKSQMDQLLAFVLSQNDENLRATTLHAATHERRTLSMIAYKERDAKLLELLLSLDSNVMNEQLREVTNKNALSVHLIKTIDFDIWVALATNTTVFTGHNECSVFQTFM